MYLENRKGGPQGIRCKVCSKKQAGHGEERGGGWRKKGVQKEEKNSGDTDGERTGLIHLFQDEKKKIGED